MKPSFAFQPSDIDIRDAGYRVELTMGIPYDGRPVLGRVQQDSFDACREAMEKARAEVLSTGPGRRFIELQELASRLQSELADVKANMKGEWSNWIDTVLSSESLGDDERHVRLRARAEVLESKLHHVRGELKAARAAIQPALRAAVRKAHNELIREATDKLNVAREQLVAAAGPAVAAWTAAFRTAWAVGNSAEGIRERAESLPDDPAPVVEEPLPVEV